MVISMIAVGEQTGGLDEMLSKIADFYDDEVDVAVSALLSLMEPIMIVVLGVIVGGMVVAMYPPDLRHGERGPVTARSQGNRQRAGDILRPLAFPLLAALRSLRRLIVGFAKEGVSNLAWLRSKAARNPAPDARPGARASGGPPCPEPCSTGFQPDPLHGPSPGPEAVRSGGFRHRQSGRGFEGRRSRHRRYLS
jgi:hypothetical protein